MKKLLGIVVLILIMQTAAFSLDRDDLTKLMSKAKTSVAANRIHDECEGEDAFLQIMYSDSCKCAIRSGKANNHAAAIEILNQCEHQ